MTDRQLSQDLEHTTSETETRNRASIGPWPSDGLEHLGRCPICAHGSRSLIHRDLVDNVAFSTTSTWQLWRCESCQSAYLDPRPTDGTLPLAYANYHTHSLAGGRQQPPSAGLPGFKASLVNGYAAWRFGSQAKPARAIGPVVLRLTVTTRNDVDASFRHLPRRPPPEASLLDLGCGSGSFLLRARSAGWAVTGLDPDPQAVATARGRGLDVQVGGIERFAGQAELFDVVTLNHVVEHLDDPLPVLQACHRLLRPSGRLWIETPNLDSFGHRRFGPNWRGLEAPRHLVLFTDRSLRTILARAGFGRVEDLGGRSPTRFTFASSRRIVEGLDADGPTSRQGLRQWAESRGAKLAGCLAPSRREFLLMIGHKTRGVGAHEESNE